jgi:hypothetical protein
VDRIIQNRCRKSSCRVKENPNPRAAYLDQGQVPIRLCISGLDHGVLLLEGVVSLVQLASISPLHRQVGGLLVQVGSRLEGVAILRQGVLDGVGGDGDGERTQNEPAMQTGLYQGEGSI